MPPAMAWQVLTGVRLASLPVTTSRNQAPRFLASSARLPGPMCQFTPSAAPKRTLPNPLDLLPGPIGSARKLQGIDSARIVAGLPVGR